MAEAATYEPRLKRVKMRAGYGNGIAVRGRQSGAPIKGKALIMGIQNYDGDRRLTNTLNDAHAVEDVFHRIGFDTHTLTDETADGGKVDGEQMYLAIEEFVEHVDENTVAAFAFMGESPPPRRARLRNQ